MEIDTGIQTYTAAEVNVDTNVLFGMKDLTYLTERQYDVCTYIHTYVHCTAISQVEVMTVFLGYYSRLQSPMQITINASGGLLKKWSLAFLVRKSMMKS